ncbi:MAG: protocatechuate 3,4-dioxygenase subunit alpha [Deltaproteobacteria bacterium]
MSAKTEQLHTIPSQTVGPFFHLGLTETATVGRLWTEATQGERNRLRFKLQDGDGEPVPDGMIELWQADASGKYAHPTDTQPPQADRKFRGFGRLATDKVGSCTFETIRPGRVADGKGGLQAAHINVSLFARGLLSRVCTRVYFEGDPALAEDPILALVPAARRQTLLAKHGATAGVWTFDIHLQGERETVFFEV